MWRSASSIFYYFTCSFRYLSTRSLSQSDPYMFLCWHKIKSKVSLTTTQVSMRNSLLRCQCSYRRFGTQQPSGSRLPFNLLASATPVRVIYLLIVVILDVWIRQMGGAGGDWDWEDYFQDANAIIKPQFDCTICSA